jgi:hypothetical protein
MSKPAPCIGLRRAVRASGEPYLSGVAHAEIVIPAGARVQLRRLRPDGPGDSPTHAIVFAPADPRAKGADLEQACRDNGFHRVDPRDADGEPAPW